MNRTGRLLRPRLANVVAVMAALSASIAVGPTSAANAQECGDVVSSARAMATVARVDASSGAALAVPATYSQLIYDSIPSVAYNQSGPSTTGQLEDPTGTNPNTLLPTIFGFSPVDPPFAAPEDPFGSDPPFIPAPPVVGRAEAAYPTLQGIPQDSENSFGPTQSEAHAYPTYSRGRASSTGLGGADGGVRSASAFTNAILECETLTLVVGWEASGVVTATGTIPSMSQIATLVVSPSGQSVTVATNVAEETEEGSPIVEGRVLDPITDPFNEQGTYIDVGEPRIVEEDGFVKVFGGGVRYGTADPERNDTYTFYTIGSLEGELSFLSVLPPVADGPLPSASPSPQPAIPGTHGTPAGQTTTQIVSAGGDVPTPSPEAEQFAAAQIQLAGISEDLTTGTYSPWPILLALVALGIIAKTAWYAADRGRDRFPTAGFAVDWFRARGKTFGTSYLQW